MFAGDGPATNVNQPTIVGFAQGVSTNLRRPFFAGNVANAQGFGGAFGWTQGIDYFCNCATNRYNSLQTKLTKRFSRGYSLLVALHAAARGQQRRRLLLHRSGREPRDRELRIARTPSRSRRSTELPFGRGKRYLRRHLAELPTPSSAAGSSTRTPSSRAACRSTSATGTRARTATRARTGRTWSAIPSGPKTRDQWFNATPIGSSRERLRPPGEAARSATWSGTRCADPGYWRTDASLFKHFAHHRDADGSRSRVEAVNLFNHVNLGQPDSEVGVPGHPEHERRPDHVDRVRQRRSAAQLPVWAEVRVLARNHMPRVTTSP